jgi:ABC-type dipeptide/oligopeptide/nickel transport system permease component
VNHFRHSGVVYFVEAALNRDYTLVMGTVVVIAIFTIPSPDVDLLYAVVIPGRYDLSLPINRWPLAVG